MLGFSALSEAPISATAEAELPLVIVPVGAIGASPIGVYAIGQASITTGGTGVSDGDASAALVTVNVSSPAPTVTAGQSTVASAGVATISVSTPQATSIGSALVEVDPSQASQTFVVIVQSTAQGNKYFIDGVQQDSLTLHENGIYRFDTSDYSVSSHPLRFSTTADGTHGGGAEYTEGVTVGSGYVEIVVTPATPDLYYYCQIHSGMGGSIAFSVIPTQSPFILQQVSPEPTISVSVTASVTIPEITVTAPASTETGSAISEAQAATIALTPAEAAGSGAAEAVFDDLIEVGVSSPISVTSAGASALAQSNQVTVTSPESTETGTAVAEATIPTVNVFTPTARFEGIEIPDALPAITVTSPETQASVSVTATASSNTVSVSAPQLNILVQTEDTVGDTTRVFITRYTGTQSVSLSLPTLEAGGTWNLGPNNTNSYWIDWNKQILAGVYRVGAYVKNNLSYKIAKWSFDSSGNYTLLTSSTFGSNDYEIGESGIVGWFGDDTDDTYLDNFDLIIQVPYIFRVTNTGSSVFGVYALINRWGVNFDASSIGQNSSFSGDQFAVGKILSSGTETVDLVDSTGIGQGRGAFAQRPTSGGFANQNLMVWNIRARFDGEPNVTNKTFNVTAAGLQSTGTGTLNPALYYNGLPSQTFHDGSQSSIDRAAEARLLTNDILVFETEVQIQGNINGQSYLVPVTSPDAGATGVITTSLPQITVTTPQGIAAGQGSVTATATIPQVTVTSPQSENTVSSIAQAVSSTITVSAPTSFETVVEIPLAKPPVIVSSPEPTVSASGQADSNGVTITVTASETIASQGSIASSQLVTVAVSALDANGSGSSVAQSESNTVTVSAPETTESVVDEPSLPVVTISAPEPTISITGDVTISVVAPVVSIVPAEASVSAGSQADAQSNVVDVEDLVAEATGTALVDSVSNTVTVTAPEGAVVLQAVDAFADLPVISVGEPEAVISLSSIANASLDPISIDEIEAFAFVYNPATGRTIIVAREDRSFEVAAEDRNTEIAFENRTIIVVT